MRLVYRSVASREIGDICEWYRDESPDLETRFIAELRSAEAFLQRNPLAGAGCGSDIRRHFLRRFPYAIYYVNEPGQIVILSVRHGHRKPRIWTVSEAPATYAP